jgi:hypothetical protein
MTICALDRLSPITQLVLTVLSTAAVACTSPHGATSSTSSSPESANQRQASESDNTCDVIVAPNDDATETYPIWSESKEPNTVRLTGRDLGRAEVYRIDKWGTFVAPHPAGNSAARQLTGQATLPTVPFWKVDCDHPSNSKIFAQLPDVNFTRSVLARSKEMVYAAGIGGLVGLNLRTGESHRVTTLKKRAKTTGKDSCNGGAQTPADIPVAFDSSDDRIVVQRGGRFGYESAWELRILHIRLNAAGTSAVDVRPGHLPTSLAQSPDGTLWLADGASATLTEGLSFEADGLLKSTDDGKSWQTVPLDVAEPETVESGPTPAGPISVSTHQSANILHVRPRQILASNTSPNRLLLVGHPSEHGGRGYVSGHFLYTADGAEHWWRVNRPAPDGETRLVVWTARAPGDDLSELEVWTVPRSELRSCRTYDFHRSESGHCEAGTLTHWRTTDGGQTWTQVSPSNQDAPPLTRSLNTKNGASLRIDQSAGQVLRTPADASSPVVVFPN